MFDSTGSSYRQLLSLIVFESLHEVGHGCSQSGVSCDNQIHICRGGVLVYDKAIPASWCSSLQPNHVKSSSGKAHDRSLRTNRCTTLYETNDMTTVSVVHAVYLTDF